MFSLRCLKRDTGLSFGTFQAGCIGQAILGSKFQMRDKGLFKHQRVQEIMNLDGTLNRELRVT